MNYPHYNILAELFRYPGENFPEKVNECQHMLDSLYPEAAAELKIFTAYINKTDVDGREELFTKTFDVQPICYLDLGYVMFGEDYKRGAFLLHMQGEQHKIGNDCGSDLPDNIVNVLTYLSLSQDEEFIGELVVRILMPSVEKMIAEFESSRVDLKVKVMRKLHKAIIQEELNQGNVYRNALVALQRVLKTDFADVKLETIEDPVRDLTYHQSFLGKNSVSGAVNNEVTQLVNNYKLD